jgi:hypothetical protein
VAAVSYSPTFHHTEWVDRLDRVVADGPNGFNNRFNAITHDLRQASTVVGQIGAALDQIVNVSPVPTQSALTFTPAMGGQNDTGVETMEISEGIDASPGVMNLVLPDGVKLQNLHVTVDLAGGDFGPGLLVVTLSRLPVRLTTPPATPDTLASISTSDPGHNTFSKEVNDLSLAQVDHSRFRYFLTASFTGNTVTPSVASIISVQIQYTPA